ncbi:MAG: right-handed parallel beta-helix repeat-containing protein [Rhodanobacter sp.]|jgi:hypothetical protein|nr:right-handed parallel beta-helix repeat-containing protein [Rhodanobacter sp.]
MEGSVYKNAPSLPRCLRAPLIRWARFALAGVLLLAIAPLASAATITVSNHNDVGAGSLRDAITNAKAGDTIVFSGLPAGDTIKPSSVLIVATGGTSASNPLTIDGSGVSGLSVSGNNAVRVFAVNAGVNAVFKNFTITQGKPLGATGSGGGILNTGTLTLNNCTVSDSTANANGGGIENNGTLTLTNSTLSGNTTAVAGGGIDNNGMLTVTNSTFNGNTITNDYPSNGYGGGIYNTDSGTLTVINSTLSNNIGHQAGGGICNSGTLTVINSTLSGNASHAEAGGGLYNAGTATLTNSTLSGNTTNFDGSGIYNDSGTLTVTNSTLSNNTAGYATPAAPSTIATVR